MSNLAHLPDPSSAPVPGVLSRLAADTFAEPAAVIHGEFGMEPVTEDSLGYFAEFFAKDADYLKFRLFFQPSGWYQKQLGGPDFCTTLQAFRIRELAAEIALRQNPLQTQTFKPREQHLAGWADAAELDAAAERRRVDTPRREESWWSAGWAFAVVLLVIVLVALSLMLGHLWHEHPEARPGYTVSAPHPNRT